MSLFGRIAAFVESAVGNKPQTFDDFKALAGSLREVDLPEAETALAGIERDFDEQYFDLAGNELALKRAEKKRDEARSNVARIREALRRAEAQAERLAAADHRAEQLRLARETDELLARRAEEICAQLDEHIAGVAKGYMQLHEINGQILARSPERLRYWPDLFSGATIQKIIEQRLYGFTEGLWHGFAGLETPHTARQLRSLAARAREERKFVMSHQPQESPPPAAA